MKLYYSPLSTYSQKALIALHEKGLAFEPELVNLMSPEGREAYQKVYPLGKVPYLVESDGWAVPESTIIIEFLDDRYPESLRLIPAEREAARQVRFMDRMCDLYLNEPIANLLFQKFGMRAVDEASAAKSRRQVDVMYGYLEQRLGLQEWLCSTGFSMADCAALPPLFYAQFAAPFANLPNLLKYWQRASTRPSYQRVMAEFLPIWEGLMNAKKG